MRRSPCRNSFGAGTYPPSPCTARYDCCGFVCGVVVLKDVPRSVERTLASATIATIRSVEWIAKLVDTAREQRQSRRLPFRCAAFDEVSESDPSVSMKLLKNAMNFSRPVACIASFNAGFDCFSAAVRKVRARGAGIGTIRQFLCQLRHVTVVIVSAAHVDQFSVCCWCSTTSMAVASGTNGDAGHCSRERRFRPHLRPRRRWLGQLPV